MCSLCSKPKQPPVTTVSTDLKRLVTFEPLILSLNVNTVSQFFSGIRCLCKFSFTQVMSLLGSFFRFNWTNFALLKTFQSLI